MNTENTENRTNAAGSDSKRIVMRQFSYGMTVRELKDLIEGWPEETEYGEECEVWIETGKNLSSPVTTVAPLNLREDDTGKTSADILFESTAFDA